MEEEGAEEDLISERRCSAVCLRAEVEEEGRGLSCAEEDHERVRSIPSAAILLMHGKSKKARGDICFGGCGLVVVKERVAFVALRVKRTKKQKETKGLKKSKEKKCGRCR